MISFIDIEKPDIVVRVITDYISAEDMEPVEILVSGFEYETSKAVELISAARKMYDALGDLINAVVAAGDINDGTIAEAVLNAERAEAAACGAVLQRDNRGKHG